MKGHWHADGPMILCVMHLTVLKTCCRVKVACGMHAQTAMQKWFRSYCLMAAVPMMQMKM